MSEHQHRIEVEFVDGSCHTTLAEHLTLGEALTKIGRHADFRTASRPHGTAGCAVEQRVPGRVTYRAEHHYYPRLSRRYFLIRED